MQEVNSPTCSGVGTYNCAVCSCGDSNYGDRCQCDKTAVGVNGADLEEPCKR